MKLSVVLCVLLFAYCSSGLVHHLHIKRDPRLAWEIESFGFAKGGVMKFTIDNLSLLPDASRGKKNDYRVGVIIHRTNADGSEFLKQEDLQNGDCPADSDKIKKKDIVEFSDFKKTNFSLTIDGKEYEEGLYTLFFYNCENGKISFDMDLTNYNMPGPNYLSVGDSPLPNVYLVFSIVFTFLTFAWVYFLRQPDTKVLFIHHLMTVLLVLKAATMLALALRYHGLKTTGEGNGWSIVYYIFAFTKGVMMFTIIALIGSGWAFIKPFLSDQDKRIFAVVIPLQVIDNVAMIVIDELAPGSQAWLAWYDVLRVVDIICCGAILFPIVWSIKHLREAAETDGKTARNVEKLQLFRQFYILVVTYIYFTRIILYLLDVTLPFKAVWVSHVCGELAAVAFYSITGYKFRPIQGNPYLHIDSDDMEMNDLEGGVEIELISDDDE